MPTASTLKLSLTAATGSIGAGIATGFRERYPAMYEEFRRRCKAKPRLFNLGEAWLWKADDRPWVFNLATQEAFGEQFALENGSSDEPATGIE